jgi:hypothetical protein
MRKKKIWLNTERTKYCWVKLFDTKREMQKVYADYCKLIGDSNKEASKTLGASFHYLVIQNGKCTNECGTVLLNREHLGAGIVAHELMHAVLNAWQHPRREKYPIVIKDMPMEEKILYNLTFAVRQFWTWYFKIEKD